jgi:hypothetical protein
MRSRSAATALTAALTAGVTAAVALHRRADRRIVAPAVPIDVPAFDAVVLPFVRPTPATVPVQRPQSPARCGDTGGRTKAGSPCGARATSTGRCHHHPVAA